MAKDPLLFLDAKDSTLENLDEIRIALATCLDEGMIDLEDTFYNQILELLEEVSVVNHWEELEELIVKAKVLEQDIAAWLSIHGRSSYSLTWPHKP